MWVRTGTRMIVPEINAHWKTRTVTGIEELSGVQAREGEVDLGEGPEETNDLYFGTTIESEAVSCKGSLICFR